MDIRDLFIAQDNAYAAAPPAAERGVITGVNGDGTVYVNCTGVGELMPIADTVGSPMVGNTVVVVRTPQGPVAALRITSTATSPTEPPSDPGTGALTAGTTYIPPTRSFSFEASRGAGRPDDDPVHGTLTWSRETRLRQGTDATGLHWNAALMYTDYSSDFVYQAPGEALLAGVTVTGAQLRIARTFGGSAPVTTKLTLTNRCWWPPQGGDQWGPLAPIPRPDWTYDPDPDIPTTLTVDVTLDPGAFAWVPLPADWWPALIGPLTLTTTGGSTFQLQCGFGLYGTGPTPEFVGPSIDDDPEQGLLRIDWTV